MVSDVGSTLSLLLPPLPLKQLCRCSRRVDHTSAPIPRTSQGRTDEAVGMYRTALSSSESEPPAARSSKHANLAHTLDAAGRYEEASTSFVTALTIEPKDAGT